MKRLFAVLLCLAMAVCLLPQRVAAATTINNVDLGLAYPEAGKAPPEAAWYGRGYTVYEAEWYDRTDGRYLEAGEKIRSEHLYEVTLWVEADSGYEFKATDDNTPAVTATVNGKQYQATKAYEYKAWAMVTVTYYFESPVPAKGWIHTADVSFSAPVAGQLASYNPINTTAYTSKNVYFGGSTNEDMKNGIAWYYEKPNASAEYLSPSNPVFAEETPYTVHFLLFPNEGYSFTSSTRVNVNGQSAKASFDYATFMSVSYTFPATGKIQTHTHTPSAWRTNQAYHYKACTTCGDFLEQGDHTGGTATCVEKGKCSICGYPYLPENENHTPDTKWTACADLYHAKLCKLCGAHCTTEDHKPGPAATETTAQTCTVCGYILAPAKNHEHKLTKVAEIPATCEKEGKREHYTCAGCSEVFSDSQGKNKLDASQLTLEALGHDITDVWRFDELYHWHACSRCGTAPTESKALHDAPEGKCATCGYTIGETIPTTEPSQSVPAPHHPTEQPKEKKPVSWVIFVLMGLVCFGIGITATILIVKKKKQ